jgi:hypothetical protein
MPRSCSFDQLTNGSRAAASGRIVLCFSTTTASSGVAALAVYAAGGAGLIFAETISRRSTQDNFLPTVHVDLRQGTRILDYIRGSSRPPTARFSPSTTLVGKSPAPAVAYFSSRGPSSISPHILKVRHRIFHSRERGLNGENGMILLQGLFIHLSINFLLPLF